MADRKAGARIFLVDDHPLVREMLTSLINQQPDLMVCGEAENAAEALRGMAAALPNIAIIDLSLKESVGMELIKAIKLHHPRIGIVVLSMHDEKLYAERCIRAGARGYVMKRESTRRIVSCIRDVLQGKLSVSEPVASAFAEKFISGQQLGGASPLGELSDRELEVFRLLGQGLETRKVAENLNVSIKTVQAYCARIKQKLQLSTATELLREAIRWHEQQAG